MSTSNKKARSTEGKVLFQVREVEIKDRDLFNQICADAGIARGKFLGIIVRAAKDTWKKLISESFVE